MELTNDELISEFFQAYSRRDLDAIRHVMDQKVRWIFPGSNPLSGTKQGIEAVVEFFDRMGSIMGQFNVKSERLVAGSNGKYVIECQHISTQRQGEANLDQELCVLWTFGGGRIIEGKHFAADEHSLDDFFTRAVTNS